MGDMGEASRFGARAVGHRGSAWRPAAAFFSAILFFCPQDLPSNGQFLDSHRLRKHFRV